MNKIVLIDSYKSGKMAFTFENGERLSIVWDGATYSDNHDNVDELLREARGGTVSWNSTTVEVFGADGEQINEYLEERYGQAPAPRVPVNDIPKIIVDILYSDESCNEATFTGDDLQMLKGLLSKDNTQQAIKLTKKLDTLLQDISDEGGYTCIDMENLL